MRSLSSYLDPLSFTLFSSFYSLFFLFFVLLGGQPPPNGPTRVTWRRPSRCRRRPRPRCVPGSSWASPAAPQQPAVSSRCMATMFGWFCRNFCYRNHPSNDRRSPALPREPPPCKCALARDTARTQLHGHAAARPATSAPITPAPGIEMSIGLFGLAHTRSHTTCSQPAAAPACPRGHGGRSQHAQMHAGAPPWRLSDAVHAPRHGPNRSSLLRLRQKNERRRFPWSKCVQRQPHHRQLDTFLSIAYVNAWRAGLVRGSTSLSACVNAWRAALARGSTSRRTFQVRRAGGPSSPRRG